VQGFLSANGFPFVIIHDAPELAGRLRKVVFETPRPAPSSPASGCACAEPWARPSPLG
jgi:hypothetical protein